MVTRVSIEAADLIRACAEGGWEKRRMRCLLLQLRAAPEMDDVSACGKKTGGEASDANVVAGGSERSEVREKQAWEQQ